jgi:type I restriction enzyme, S subunit
VKAPAVKLSDVCEINPRFRNGMSEKDEEVAFVPMAAVSAETASVKVVETRLLSTALNGFTYFQNGDILVAKITPCFENGKIAQAHINFSHGFGSTEFHVIRPRPSALDARYLLHFLRQPRIRLEGVRKMTGSAGQRRVPKHFLETLEMTLPPVPEQRRLAAILDHVETLRKNRREALTKLNILTQSIFLELFGDPASNPKNWPVVTIGDLVDETAYGSSEKASTAGKLPMLRMNNITYEGGWTFEDMKYFDFAPELLSRYTVRSGDILFNRTNSKELVGKSAVYRETVPMGFAGYLIRVRTNNATDPEYLGSFLNTAYAKRVLQAMCKNIIGMANINAQELRSIRIPKPPFEIQKRFGRIVSHAIRNREIQIRSQAKLDALFESLQDRAFGGEL